MRELWWLPTKGVVEGQVFGRRNKPFCAANHMGDFHQMIVYDICEMVSRQPIAFQQDRIFERVVCPSSQILRFPHRAVDKVIELRIPVRRKEPDYMPLAFMCPVVGLFLWYGCACAVIVCGKTKLAAFDS